MAGYVAADKNGTVTASQVAPGARWNDIVFAKNSTFSLTPDLTDTHVYMDEFVNMLVSKYGKANTDKGIR